MELLFTLFLLSVLLGIGHFYLFTRFKSFTVATYYVVWSIACVAFTRALLTSVLDPIFWVTGLVIVVPFCVALAIALSGRALPPWVWLLGCVAAVGLGFATIANAPLIALHNNYPFPTLTIAISWLGFTVLFSFLPRHVGNPRILGSLFAVIVGLGLASTVALSTIASTSAQSIYPNGPCIIDNFGNRFPKSHWISPRSVIVASNGRYEKNSWLSLAPTGGDATHHWSFKQLRFVEDEPSFSRYPRSIRDRDAKIEC